MILPSFSASASVLVLFLIGDVVTLENGREIQGEIIRESPEHVTLRFPGGTVDLPKSRIRKIRRERRLDYLLQEGGKQVRRGSYEDAAQTFEAALEEDPDSTRAREGLLEARELHAAALRDLGRYDEAREAFRSILAIAPDRSRVHEELQGIDRTLEDARREEKRGLEELAEGHLDQAVWRLLQVHDRFPDRREALGRVIGEAMVEQGNELLQAGQTKDAESRYLRALTLDPELLPLLERQFVLARHLRIEPLLAEGDFARVRELVEEGLELSPTSEVLRYYRGLCLEAEGEKREAAEEYLSILDRRRPHSLEDSVGDLRLEVEARLSDQGRVAPIANPHSGEVLPGAFRELRTEYFVVRHRNPAVARDVALVAERSYRRLFGALGCTTHLRNPLQIVIYPSREEYLEASGLGPWSGGSHRIARRLGTLSDHRILSYQGQPCLTSAILPHEITHALLALRLNYPKKIPIWANEGFSVLQEPEYFHRHYRRLISQEAGRKGLIPLRTLLDLDEYPADRVSLFYGQSFSLVEYLVSLEDLETFLAFLQSLSRLGSEIEKPLKRYYRIAGVQALENRWIGWFKRANRGG